jgi:hypothetical protein
MCYQSTLGHLGKQEVQMTSANKLQNGVPKKLQSFVVLDAKVKIQFIVKNMSFWTKFDDSSER